MRRFKTEKTEYDSTPGICFLSVPTIFWELTFSGKLEHSVMHENHFYIWRVMVFHRKYHPVHPNARMRQLDSNIQDVLKSYPRCGVGKQIKIDWSPNWDLFWNICFKVNKSRHSYFSQPFSKKHVESQILDEFCDNLHIKRNLMGENFPIPKFQSVKLPGIMLKFCANIFTQSMVNTQFCCFEMADKASYFSTDSLFKYHLSLIKSDGNMIYISRNFQGTAKCCLQAPCSQAATTVKTFPTSFQRSKQE